MATWAIGDLQGCREEFAALLAAIDFDSAVDELWLVGDLLNRGPDSLGVLRDVMALGDACRVVLGNHDLHFLAVFYGGHEPRRSDTLEELLAAADVETLAAWLRRQPLVHHSESLGWLMVHAGVPPLWSLSQLVARAEEAQQFYAGAGGPEFFAGMYGNTPARFHDELRGLDRIRCIVNYLTRMRLVAADGTLDFAHKGAPGAAIAESGLLPWFAQSRKRPLGCKIAFGHWAALEGELPAATQGQMAALDTGCVWGRELTALCLESGDRVSVPAVAVQNVKT